MKLQRRVVVTGLGLISPLGNNVSSSWSACVAGESGITNFDNSIENSPVTIGGRIKNLDVSNFIDSKDLRRLDTFIQYGYIAAHEAINDSGFLDTNINLDAGRKKITGYTRYGTIVLSVVQGFAIAVGLESMAAPNGQPIVISTLSPWAFRAVAVITLTAGTAFLMWVGEQISERGIGNGISLLIFAGIVVGIPGAIINSIRLVQDNVLSPLVLVIVVVLMVVVIFLVIFAETAYRKIPVQYAKRMQGNRMFGGQSSHLPLKINTAGVIPPIFASSILAFPATITGFIAIPWVQAVNSQLLPGRMLYNLLFAIMIFFFAFFYTAITFNPVKISEEMKKHGGYIPGIRPGKKTAEYVNLVLSRLTFGGATYLSIVCLFPYILFDLFDIPFYFGGTALLIVVGVGLDLVNQIEAFLLNQNYDGFMKKTKRRQLKPGAMRL